MGVTRTATAGAVPIPLCPAAESEPPGGQGQRCWPKPHPRCGCSNRAHAGGLPPFPAPRLEAIPAAWRVESRAWCQGEAASPGPWCQGEAALLGPRQSPGARSLRQGALEGLKDLESVLGDFCAVGGVPPSFHIGSNIVPSLAGLLLGSSHRSL